MCLSLLALITPRPARPVAVGFFGSLSTFSTFAVELLTTLKQRNWRESLLLSVGSILGGLVAAGLGYGLGLAEGIA